MPACSTCGFESERRFRFCPVCGAEQAAATPSREQRKTVTVLFCDLIGSTALGERSTPAAVGGGTRALPDHVRVKLELLNERRFGDGVVHMQYRTQA